MEFRDLKKQYQYLKSEIDSNILEVIVSSHFISGSKVAELERKLAEYVGVKHCITCANGTDAISIGLKAMGVEEGDAVFVPDFTFFSSGECPACEGATPLFVDVDKNTYNINPSCLEKAVQKVIAEGKYKAKAVVAVDLFGLPADLIEIRRICDKYGMLLLEDGAQGFGGSINGKMACSFGDISTTSFFPAKPLGCYGDGGAIFTDNDDWADLIRSICVHGKDTSNPNDPNAKYNNIRLGMNSRLDTIQAAILIPKFKAFVDYELEDVNKVASWYTENLENTGLILPILAEGYYSSWAQYTVQLPENVNRKEIQAKLKACNIPSMIYYAKPMHFQGAFSNTDSAVADCPVTEKLCKTVLSLPIHPYMSKEDVKLVSCEIKNALINNYKEGI